MLVIAVRGTVKVGPLLVTMDVSMVMLMPMAAVGMLRALNEPFARIDSGNRHERRCLRADSEDCDGKRGGEQGSCLLHLSSLLGCWLTALVVAAQLPAVGKG